MSAVFPKPLGAGERGTHGGANGAHGGVSGHMGRARPPMLILPRRKDEVMSAVFPKPLGAGERGAHGGKRGARGCVGAHGAGAPADVNPTDSLDISETGAYT